jgi:hypothetical protein
MISADHEALVLADVAGALDSDEREQLRASLEVLPPEERAHVAHLYDLGITLAEIAADAPPPPHLRLTKVNGSMPVCPASACESWRSIGIAASSR